MNNFFVYDSAHNRIEINRPEILLIKEFAALANPERNKCKEDPTGEYGLRMFRELTYIYLALHWHSLYSDISQGERHEAALKDSQLTDEEFNDPVFREACRKFQEMQNQDRSIRLLESARFAIDKIANYFVNIDPEERDELTGKPMFQVKNLIQEINSLNKLHDSLTTLESQVKKELAERSSIRGGAEDGFMPEGDF